MASTGMVHFGVSEHGWARGGVLQYGGEYLSFSVGELFVVLVSDPGDGWVKVAALVGGGVGWVPRSYLNVFSVPHFAVSKMLLPPSTPPMSRSEVAGDAEEAADPEAELPPTNPLHAGLRREFCCDGSDGGEGFASAVVEVLSVAECAGDFRGPIASELIAVQLAIDEVARAVERDPPVGTYIIRNDNLNVVDWMKGVPLQNTQATQRFKPLIDHVKRSLAELQAAAAPAKIEIAWVNGDFNSAHGVANGQLCTSSFGAPPCASRATSLRRRSATHWL